MAKKRKIKKDPNEEIGPKYNIAAWQHFGRTEEKVSLIQTKYELGTLKNGHHTQSSCNPREIERSPFFFINNYLILKVVIKNIKR